MQLLVQIIIYNNLFDLFNIKKCHVNNIILIIIYLIKQHVFVSKE